MFAALPIRQTDNYGSGLFGASRDGGSRTHKGVDFCCYPGTKILAPACGRVIKIGYPYGDDLSFRYVRIETVRGDIHTVMYISPLVEVGDSVIGGLTAIGESQDLQKRYPSGMTNHVHYDIKKQGVYVDPTDTPN